MSLFSPLRRAARKFRGPNRPSTTNRSPQRSPALGFECLEDRWVPSVTLAGITGLGTNSVTVTDSDTGQTNNAIAIIDDLDTQTTYIKINGGAEVQLGAAGTILADLTVHMGGGNDQISFSVRGNTASAYTSGDVTRSIDLGAGDDSLSIDAGSSLNLDGHNLRYVGTLGTTTGNDSYSLSGTVASGYFYYNEGAAADASGNDRYSCTIASTGSGEVRATFQDSLGDDRYAGTAFATGGVAGFQITDSAGNDQYTISGGATASGYSNVHVYDGAGNDRYTARTLDSANSTVSLFAWDNGPGTNSVTYTQGTLVSVQSSAYFQLLGATTNTATLNATGSTTNSTVNLYYFGMDGTNAVTYTGNSQLPTGVTTVVIGTGSGNDTVTANLNSSTASPAHSLVSNVSPNSITNQYGLHIILGDGNDRATVNAASLNRAGGSAQISVDGGAGNDQIKVDLGTFGGTSANYSVNLYGGTGADKITLNGNMPNGATNQLSVYVDLGNDTDRDTFQSKLDVGAASAPDQLHLYYDNTSSSDELTFKRSSVSALWTLY